MASALVPFGGAGDLDGNDDFMPTKKAAAAKARVKPLAPVQDQRPRRNPTTTMTTKSASEMNAHFRQRSALSLPLLRQGNCRLRASLAPMLTWQTMHSRGRHRNGRNQRYV